MHIKAQDQSQMQVLQVPSFQLLETQSSPINQDSIRGSLSCGLVVIWLYYCKNEEILSCSTTAKFFCNILSGTFHQEFGCPGNLPEWLTMQFCITLHQYFFLEQVALVLQVSWTNQRLLEYKASHPLFSSGAAFYQPPIYSCTISKAPQINKWF